MLVKALRNFAGSVSMVTDEVKDVDAYIAQDLIRAGYAEAVIKTVKKPVTKKKK